MNLSHEIVSLVPQSPEAERAVICAFFLDQERVGSILAEIGISTEHFSLESHADIFNVQQELYSTAKPGDLLGVTQVLRDRGILDKCGGAGYVTDLRTLMPTAQLVRRDAKILTDKLILRRMLAICNDYKSRVVIDADDAPVLLESFANAISGICLKKEDEAKTWKELLVEKWERIRNDAPEIGIIQTGISLLDKHSPLRLGSMPLISGEAKAGKSILAIAISANVAKDGGAVLYFSLEDPASRVVDRFFSNISQVPAVRHSAKWMNEGEFQRCEIATRQMQDWNFHLRCDTADLAHIVAICRQKKASIPDLKLIVLDYAQLVRARQKGENREQEVANVSRTLRLLGIELNVAMLVLCQLNKDGDTRESTSLEKDMTAMWKISIPEKGENKRHISIPRQRDGESGIFGSVAFFGSQSRIENFAEDPE